MPRLLIHTPRGPRSAMLVSAGEQQEQRWFQNYINELDPLLTDNIKNDLARRGLVVAHRDVGLLLARLRSAHANREHLPLDIED